MKVEIANKIHEVFAGYGEIESLRFRIKQNLNFNGVNASIIAFAAAVAGLIKQKQLLNQTCFLGLNTESKTIGVYEELVRMNKEEGLSFANVEVFIREGYFPIDQFKIQCSYSFLKEHLLDHIDIFSEKVHFLDDKAYELNIKAIGGLDFNFSEIQGIAQKYYNRESHLKAEVQNEIFNNDLELISGHSMLDNLNRTIKASYLRIV